MTGDKGSRYTMTDKMVKEISKAINKEKFEKFETEDILLYLSQDLHCIDEPESWKEAIGAVFVMLHEVPTDDRFAEFIQDIEQERERQNEIHPDVKHSRVRWKLLIIEEYGEMVQAWNNYEVMFSYECNTFDMQAKYKLFTMEAIQFVAMIVRFLEEAK